jgi:hypothetical protein
VHQGSPGAGSLVTAVGKDDIPVPRALTKLTNANGLPGSQQ